MRLRGRLGGRGAAGRRRTGPEVVDPAGERSAHWSDDGGLCAVTRADITCVERTYGMCRYDRTDARLTLLDQSEDDHFKHAVWMRDTQTRE